MYFDDYFYEESEFDERINELKDSLRSQVKEEIKNKIEELTKRNKELEERQKNLSSLEKEYQDILAKAPRDSQGRLLAPNGKPSNLTERQYA